VIQQEAQVTRNYQSIDIDEVTELIDSLIQRGLRRVEAENATVTILDYIRLLQLSPEMQREDDLPEVIWVDDLDSFDLDSCDLESRDLDSRDLDSHDLESCDLDRCDLPEAA
jgi:hypothetical protein